MMQGKDKTFYYIMFLVTCFLFTTICENFANNSNVCQMLFAAVWDRAGFERGKV